MIDYIKTLINELSPTDGLPVPIDTFADDRPLDDMIATLLPEATHRVLLLAPKQQLPVATLPTTSATLGPDGNALLEKPADLVRFVGLRLGNWQRRVEEADAPDSPRAQRQTNPCLRAGYAKPVVVDGGPCYWLYPATAADLAEGVLEYVPETHPELLNLKLREAVAWQCAALYLQVIGHQQAQQAEQKVYLLLK
ncbi:MAG: hypothetical protein J6I79_05375 [Paludibacteraceae bacterium]|nr:hypothetical protein [Paludibacteraceae bacterium]